MDHDVDKFFVSFVCLGHYLFSTKMETSFCNGCLMNALGPFLFAWVSGVLRWKRGESRWLSGIADLERTGALLQKKAKNIVQL